MGFFSPGKSYSNSQEDASASNESFSGLDPNAISRWRTLFNGAQQGIAPWQQAAFGQAMNQALTKFSALDAAKGGMNPFTIPQIASSAAQYVVPKFAEMNTALLGNLLGQRQISKSAGRSQMSRSSSGTQSGPGIGYNWANDFGSNLTKWAAPSSGGGFKGGG
jgi:hypothetical protein